LEAYIYPLSAYFIYDLMVMYEGHVMASKEELDKKGEDVQQLSFKRNMSSFLKKNIFMVIHHVVLEAVGLPVIFVSCVIFSSDSVFYLFSTWNILTYSYRITIF